MVMVQIPSLSEIGAGIGYVANGACDMASSAVQQWVSSPSTAQTGLNVLAAQIETLEHLVLKLRAVADGIEQIHTRLVAVQDLEWHSPAGQAFREALVYRQLNARQLENTAAETVRLARHSIDELRALVSGLQSLVATARASLGDSVSGTIAQVCS